MPKDTPSTAAMQTFVRVIGSRLDTYVEFEFSLNDKDLTVELILPFRAFEDFCDRQKAVILPAEPEVADLLERQAWRLHQPGLLRRIRTQDGGDA
ncbi:phenol hydroxylase subunit [Xanthobacter agilis]|uniref:Phenol hydroxylase P0 protein n=2 Tax=Xanthobacter agilis TaxID=47492 RepID=A0ABU0LFB2_XANAG|nr:phenol hydroxylase subunit [Xanthobacter agilis]MDQ0505822.1 phenol hydroxylase P0 protein [Xanthobacter agilis]